MKFLEKRKILMKIFCYVFFILVLLITGFSSTNVTQDVLVSIDLKKVIQDKRDVPISQFVEAIEYIPLELTPESGISFIRKIYLTGNYIIVRHDSPGSTNPLLLFDRKSGKFVRKLGTKGRGPEEYTIPLNCFYNPYDNKIYAYGSMKSSVKSYDLTGKFLESFRTPQVIEGSSKFNLPIDAFLNAETYVGYINNSTGQIGKKIAVFSKDRKMINFPNYEKWPSGEVTIDQEPLFFTWAKKVSFKERSNDTIFSVSLEKLTPRFALNSGDSRYPYKLSREEAIEQISKPKDYIETLNVFENSYYLFFDLSSKLMPVKENPSSFLHFRNFCIFENKTKSTVACTNDANNNSGLTDDINGFMLITPITISENNELIGALQAIEIKKWKTKNKDKLVKLNLKLPWLNKIDELDNPVIVIARCKK